MMKNVYSVGQVNTYIKNMFAQDFMLKRISVKGEVSNCKYHSSGHIYFTLKERRWGNQRSYVFRKQTRTDLCNEGGRQGSRNRFDRGLRA